MVQHERQIILLEMLKKKKNGQKSRSVSLFVDEHARINDIRKILFFLFVSLSLRMKLLVTRSFIISLFCFFFLLCFYSVGFFATRHKLFKLDTKPTEKKTDSNKRVTTSQAKKTVSQLCMHEKEMYIA